MDVASASLNASLEISDFHIGLVSLPPETAMVVDSGCLFTMPYWIGIIASGRADVAQPVINKPNDNNEHPGTLENCQCW